MLNVVELFFTPSLFMPMSDADQTPYSEGDKRVATTVLQTEVTCSVLVHIHVMYLKIVRNFIGLKYTGINSIRIMRPKALAGILL